MTIELPKQTRVSAVVRHGSRTATDSAAWLFLTVSTVTALLWVAAGGLSQIGERAGLWLALGQLTGLAAGLTALAGLVLVARPAVLERSAGLDRLWQWHRLAGITTVAALALHIVASSVGFAGGSLGGAVAELISLLGSRSWMVAAFVGAVLFFTIAGTSWRRIRTHMSYETWLMIHLIGYLAVLLGLGHQLTLGSSMSGPGPATSAMKLWWIALYLAVAAVILWSRLGGLLTAALSGRGTVIRVQSAARGVTALEIQARGRRIGRARAGQFFILRFLTADLWWQAHPVSLSNAPSGGRLRFTIKALGDGSRSMVRVPPGTQVMLEGPYGRFTADRAHGRPVLLIGGGVGLAPLVGVLSDCHPGQQPVLVARVPHGYDVPHAEELNALIDARDGRLFLVDGPRGRWNCGRPFDANVLLTAVPDLRRREVFVCGPPSLIRSVERGLRGAGVGSEQIHVERFGV